MRPKEFMTLDIHTLAIILSLANFLQVIALFIQYRLNKIYKGLGWWTLGSAAWAFGFVFNYLRDTPGYVGPAAIAANNFLFIAGMILLYVGVMRFQGLRERRFLLTVICTVVTLIAIYFTYFDPNLVIRRVNISVGLAAISYLIAWRLYIYRIRFISVLTHFLASIFALNGLFFTVRAFSPFMGGSAGNIFSASLMQTATYLDALVISTLWTFGFIILVYQRLNVENNEARENQDLIFNTSPDIFMVTRLNDGCYVAVNEGFTTLTGYSRAEVIGKTTLEGTFWKDPLDRQKIIAELNQKGFCENLEIVIECKNGSQLTGLISAKIFAMHGVPHIISVTRDISKLRRAENKFRMLFELSPVGLAMVDNETGEFLEVNDAILRSSGYGRDEFLKLSFWDITPREYEAQEMDQLRQLKETGRFGPNEKEYIRKDGSRYPITISGVLFVNEDGRQVVWGIIEDISERKKAEKEKQKTDDWLRTLSVAIEQTPVTTVITDLAGNIVFVNPRFTETTGYTVEEVIGQNPKLLKTGETPGTAYQELWETILAGQNWHGVFHNKKKNGDLYWESAVISPVKDVNGHITHFLAVKEDITERKRMQEELEKQATTDELTGVTNRRHFLKLAHNELKRAARLNHPLAMAVIDIDHFKTINDTYGHAGGDQALVTFAKTCHENIREIDVFARFGGDEFIMLLPESSCEQALAVIERVRHSLAAHPMEIGGSQFSITISSGITGLKNNEESFDSFLNRSDQALYQAKEAGRDRVVVDSVLLR